MHINHDYLQFTVENSVFGKQHFHEGARNGKGLENLKRRLELLYPHSSNLKVNRTPTTYTTHLKITLTNEPI